MAWTEAQKEAIYKRGSNIIVSAGAGSGKTAVLSERILEFCKNGGDIKRVLVLTFTEAAASEMKERIRKKLRENNLLEASSEIDSSYITTFDSYSLSIVKKYFYKLGIKKEISIMDGAFIKIRKEEIIRDLFTEYYLKHEEAFLKFLDKYSLQDDKDILKMVEDITEELDLIADLDSFTKTYPETYFSEEKLHSMISNYMEYVRESVKEFLSSLNDLRDECEMDPASFKMEEALDLFLSHFNPDAPYTELYQILSGYSLPRVAPRAGASVKDAKEKCADLLKNLKNNVFKSYESTESMKNEILSTKDDVLFLLGMSLSVMKRMEDYKKSIGLYGFSDIAKYAIKLVRDYPDVRNELKSSYDEILVDEYQDTSDIQETFLSYIENNNRYMVGDIKQSIYRFRNANPYIFKSKYDSYSKNMGGYKIDLTHNFRSRSEVLANINLIFDSLMTMDMGDADYKKEHEMTYGQKDYLSLVQDYDYNMQILSYTPDMESTFSQAETEAFITGYDIKKKIAGGIKVLHKDKFETVSYNDFAVLISTASDFLTYKKVFEYLNIPLSIEASMDLKESVLPSLYSNMLFILSKEKENSHDKDYLHALVSIGRSFLYEMSDEDLYLLVNGNKDYVILSDIKKLTLLSEISYSELFYRITDILGVYEKLYKIGDVDSSLAILEHIHSSFSLFDDVGYSLSSASEYLKKLLSSGIKMEYKPVSSIKNAVRIMTIHKSKGLEFPFCYFPLLTERFNQADMRVTTGLSREFGLFIPFADIGKSSTIIRTLYQMDVKKKDVSEKIRLFYVALTRAREQMIFILPKRDEEKEIREYRSFADMLYSLKDISPYYKEIDLKDYPVEDYNDSKRISYHFEGKEELSYEALDELKPSCAAHISKSLTELPDKNILYTISLGNLYHEALESLDLTNPDIDALDLSTEMKENLRNLLSKDIFTSMKNAKIFQEHEFIFSEDNESYHGIIDLMAVYSDHVDIIDYKLSNTSKEEYIRQLSIYKSYAKRMTGKNVHTYLLSILKNEITEV